MTNIAPFPQATWSKKEEEEEEDIFADKAITWLTIITFLNLAHLRDVVGTLIAEYIHRLHAVCSLILFLDE